MRTLLLLLLLAVSVVLGRLGWENAPFSAAGSPFSALCLGLLALAWAALLLSVLLYRRRTAIVQNLWLLLLSGSIALVAGDLAANRLRDVHRYARIVPDPVVHHRLEPSTESVMRSNEFRAVLKTNRHGLRGPAPADPKPPDEYRLLLLGDSFTMGEGVAEEETFPARLARSLSAALPARVTVINAGVDSYAPILSYLDLKTNLLALAPDAVVLALDVSDLLQERFYRSLAVFGPEGDPLAVPSPKASGSWTVALEGWISRNLYFLRYAFLQARDRINGGDPDDVQAVIARQNDRLLLHTLEADTVDRTEQWNDLFDSLLRIRDLCARQRLPFFLAVYPWGHQVDDREWVPGREAWMPADARVSDASFERIRAFCRDSGIPLIDTVPAFRARSGGPALYFRWDMHWTPAGHAVMEEELRRRLEGPLREDLRSRRGEGDASR